MYDLTGEFWGTMKKNILIYSIALLIGVSLTSVKAGAPTGIGSGLGVLSRLFDYRGLKTEDEYNTKLEVLKGDLKELEGLEGDTSKELRRRIEKKINRLHKRYMRSAGNQALLSSMSSIGSEALYNPEHLVSMVYKGANTRRGLALDSAAAASEWLSYGGARKLGRNLKKRKILTLLLAATDIARFFSEVKGRERASHRKNVTVPLLFIQRILKLYRYYLARGFKNISLRDIITYAALTGSAFGTTQSAFASAREDVAREGQEAHGQRLRDAYQTLQWPVGGTYQLANDLLYANGLLYANDIAAGDADARVLKIGVENTLNRAALAGNYELLRLLRMLEGGGDGHAGPLSAKLDRLLREKQGERRVAQARRAEEARKAEEDRKAEEARKKAAREKYIQRVKSLLESGDYKYDEDCSICSEGLLSEIDEYGKIVTTGQCQHVYHHKCLDGWTKKKGASAFCPLCRADYTASSVRKL